MIRETISRQNQFKRSDKNVSNVLQHLHKNYIEKVHHTSQHEQGNIQEQHFDLEMKPHLPSKSTTKQHSKNNCWLEVKTKKKHIGSLNENITNEDIYKLFRLKTTEYLYQMSSADLKMFEKAKKTRFWICYCTRICLNSTYRAK